MEFTRSALEDDGFSGFVRLCKVPGVGVDAPAVPGVYVVFRKSTAAPAFLTLSGAGHFRQKDPTKPVAKLERKWVPGAQVLYFGQTQGPPEGLRDRVDLLRRFGSREPVGHWGGRYIWQLEDWADLLVAWLVTPAGQDPATKKAELLGEFENRYGVLPFANINQPPRAVRTL